MMPIVPAGLQQLASGWSGQAMQGSIGLLQKTGQGGLTVPQSALAMAPGVPAARVAQDWKTAEGFAAMAMSELLQPIFDTVHLSKSRFGGGAGEAAWKPILVQAIGQDIAALGGLGITGTVFRELLRQQQAGGKPAPGQSQSPDEQSPGGRSPNGKS